MLSFLSMWKQKSRCFHKNVHQLNTPYFNLAKANTNFIYAFLVFSESLPLRTDRCNVIAVTYKITFFPAKKCLLWNIKSLWKSLRSQFFPALKWRSITAFILFFFYFPRNCNWKQFWLDERAKRTRKYERGKAIWVLGNIVQNLLKNNYPFFWFFLAFLLIYS